MIGQTANKASRLIDVKNFTANGRKIIGAAFNYMDAVHARGLTAPKTPVLFLKPTTSYIKEGQNIVIPKIFTKIAHEVELGVVISRTCRNVHKQHAMKYIGGYCLALDLTAQCELGDARRNGRCWCLGKGFDTSTPVSKIIEPPLVKHLDNLELWLKINGEIRQKGNTKDLIFKIPELIEYASKYMTLEKNDLILSGTPDGVSLIACGDEIECGLGDLIEFKFKVTREGEIANDFN